MHCFSLEASKALASINLHSRKDKQTPRPVSSRLFCRKLPVSTTPGFCDLLIRSYLRRGVSFSGLDLLSLRVVCELWIRHSIKKTEFSESLTRTASARTGLIDEFNECHIQACPVLNAAMINDYTVINIIIYFLRYLLPMPQFVGI